MCDPTWLVNDEKVLVEEALVTEEEGPVVRRSLAALPPARSELFSVASGPPDTCTGRLLCRTELAAEAAAAQELNSYIYPTVNNGVYRCGFARSEAAYTAAHNELFAALDEWNDVLADRPFLCGDALTLADIALFPTLIRFDPVYYVHFKTSKKHVYEYANLWRLVQELYALPGVAKTVSFDHIRTHYFASHLQINPTGFVPEGPDMKALLARG